MADAELAGRYMHLVDGFVSTQLLYVAASLEHVHGAPFFEHLHRHPEQYDLFQASMAGRAPQEARDVVAACRGRLHGSAGGANAIGSRPGIIESVAG